MDTLFEQMMNAPAVPAAPYYDGPIKSRSHS
jgi:hypothetical protein